MTSVFGDAYADAYDAIYATKDYDEECALVEALFRRSGKSPIESVLDIGCGTGNHALPLARRGYDVVGVDLSEEMLKRARQKAEGTQATFVHGDARSFDLGRQFDAVLLLFAVLGYQTTNNDILATLRTARRHLCPGGVLVMDAWFGPAVLALRPEERTKVIDLPDGSELERSVSGSLDILRQTCLVRISVARRRGGAIEATDVEEHWMRYFFPQELGLFFTSAGFDAPTLTQFPDVDREPTEASWNFAAVARAAVQPASHK